MQIINCNHDSSKTLSFHQLNIPYLVPNIDIICKRLDIPYLVPDIDNHYSQFTLHGNTSNTIMYSCYWFNHEINIY